IQRWTELPGDLFDSILVFENFPVAKVLESDEWLLKVDNVIMNEDTNYPLNIIIFTGDRLEVQFKYNASLLDETTLLQISEHFRHVLLQIIDSNVSTVKEISLLTTREEHTLLHSFNDTNRRYLPDTTIKSIFEARVEISPEATAIIFRDKRYSYREINERANQIAHYLLKSGVGKETLVPVLLDRSVEVIIALLGILKAGAAYIPLDAGYPQERINYILQNSGAGVMITDKKHSEIVSAPGMKNMICLDGQNNIREQALTNTDLSPDKDQLICVLFTSGSSGKPKGVELVNDSILNRFYWMWESYPFESHETCVLKTSFSFGDHIWEIFGPLLQGIPSLLLAGEELFDLDIFMQQLTMHKITRIILVPSLLHAVLGKVAADETDLSQLKYWTCSGEALTSNLTDVFRILLPSARLINIYGSTEVTADVTYYDFSIEQPDMLAEGGKHPVKFVNGKLDMSEAGDYKNVPIGRPVANARIYVLDKQHRLCPVGVQGEIFVGGIPVARGYLNHPELMESKFIRDPFNDNGSFMYSTGDLGRWSPDGILAYLGRIDHQVKIRGNRMELGEIENTLNGSPDVKQSVVVIHAGKNKDKLLVAYVVPEGEFKKQEIVQYLKRYLPDYMLPSMIIGIEKIPLMISGKIDRKQLEALPLSSLLPENTYEPPGNETEAILCEIWEELLEVKRVGVYDNFFELGGHSLLAMRMVAYIRKRLEISVPMNILFHLNNINDLSKYITLKFPEKNENEDQQEYELINL
ncbi:amino acid adenylation domain-containing protein, partial [Chitinophaga oryziterrae]